MRRLFSPWAVVLYLFVCFWAALWHNREASQQGRDLLALVAALVTGGGAIYGLLLNVQTLRANSAARFIERWNSPEMISIREAMRRPRTSSMPESAGELDVNRGNAEVANFFEELAIAVLHHGADDHVLKDFFCSPLCDSYRNLEGWIAEMRSEKQQPTACIHFTKLYKKWSKVPWRHMLHLRKVGGLLSSKRSAKLTLSFRHHTK